MDYLKESMVMGTALKSNIGEKNLLFSNTDLRKLIFPLII